MVYYYNLTLSFIAESKIINEAAVIIAPLRAWRPPSIEPRPPPESSPNAGHASTVIDDARADDDGGTP